MKKYWKTILILFATLCAGYISWCAISPSTYRVKHSETVGSDTINIGDSLSSISSWIQWDPILKLMSLGSNFELSGDTMAVWYRENGPNYVKLKGKTSQSVKANFSFNSNKSSEVTYSWRIKGEELIVTANAELHIASFLERPFAEIREKQMLEYLEAQAESLKNYLNN